MPKTAKRTWKDFESKIAKALGGQRACVMGIAAPDVTHESYEIECKLRAKLAFVKWFDQAKKHSRKSGKIPLLVCKQKHHKTAYVILRLDDFKEIEAKK